MVARGCIARAIILRTVHWLWTNPGMPSKSAKSASTHERSRPPSKNLYMVPWAPKPKTLHTKWHLRRFSCFCGAHGREKQTDRHTDRAITSMAMFVAIGCIVIWRKLKVLFVFGFQQARAFEIWREVVERHHWEQDDRHQQDWLLNCSILVFI